MCLPESKGHLEEPRPTAAYSVCMHMRCVYETCMHAVCVSDACMLCVVRVCVCVCGERAVMRSPIQILSGCFLVGFMSYFFLKASFPRDITLSGTLLIIITKILAALSPCLLLSLCCTWNPVSPLSSFAMPRSFRECIRLCCFLMKWRNNNRNRGQK